MAKTIRRTRIGRKPVTVRIRPAVPKDTDILRRLERQADEVHVLLMPDVFQLPPGKEVQAPTLDRDSSILVADTSAGVVGYVAVKVVDRPTNPAMTARRRAYVDMIVVDEGHRGRGLGTALMRAAADWARQRQVVEMVLTVWSDNRPAEALYRRLGYKPIARVLRQEL